MSQHVIVQGSTWSTDLNEHFVNCGLLVLNSNHKKAEYREDGICNRARGVVQAVQVSRNNPDKLCYALVFSFLLGDISVGGHENPNQF